MNESTPKDGTPARPTRAQQAWAGRLTWNLCAFVSGVAVVALAQRMSSAEAPRSAGALAIPVLESILSIAFGVVAALIVARQPHNTIGWLLMWIALGSTAGLVIDMTLPLALGVAPRPTAVVLLLAWLDQWVWWLTIGPLLLIVLLFPSGRLPSSRWRWALVALAAVFGSWLVRVTFAVSFDILETESLANPLGVLSEAIVADYFDVPWTIALAATVAACVAAVLVRYRRAAAQERIQIKWFVYACAIFLLAYSVAIFAGGERADYLIVVGYVAILTIVASIGIAILRYRLFDIDVLIRRTLVYGLLTAALGGVYVVLIVVLQYLFVRLTGQRSQLAVAASTLAIAALFGPLRRRVQAFIDRRFYRSTYDAALIQTAFAARLRDQTDLDALAADLLGVVQETIQPELLTLWLYGSAQATPIPRREQDA